MSGVTIQVDAAPVDGLLRRLAAASRDMTPAMRAVGQLVVSSVADNFREGQGPDLVKWKPSKRALGKAGKKRAGQTLIDTARLKNSVVSAVSGSANGTAVAVGTNVEYAAIHQFGGVINRQPSSGVLHFKSFKSGKRKGRTLFSVAAKATHGMRVGRRGHAIHMPARPFLGVRAADWPRIADVLTLFLAKAAQSGGGQP